MAASLETMLNFNKWKLDARIIYYFAGFYEVIRFLAVALAVQDHLQCNFEMQLVHVTSARWIDNRLDFSFKPDGRGYLPFFTLGK